MLIETMYGAGNKSNGQEGAENGKSITYSRGEDEHCGSDD